MGWQVVYAQRSERDLSEIVAYIARDDPAAAVRFGELLINKAEALAGAPEMGPILPGKPSTRFLPVGAYLIIYRNDARGQVVRVLRFWHSARRQRPTR